MIVGLFTDLLSPGGVQIAGRQSCAVLMSFASELDCACRVLSLNSPFGEHRISLAGRTIPFQGFGALKTRFLTAALRLAAQQPRIAFAGHPNLAPPAATMKFLAPQLRVFAVAHGVEVWAPLPLIPAISLRRADFVLGPSRDTCQKLTAVQGVPETKVRCVPWGLDPEILSFAASPNHLPLPSGFPQGKILLTVGRWSSAERYKGTDQLIETLPRLVGELHDLQLVAVGEGDDRTRLEELARRSGVAGRVHFFQGLSRAQVAACLARSDVFSLPSRGEGFGLVFLEAMAFGKPVIGGRHGGILEIVQDGKTGFLVEYGDQEELSEAVRSLFRNDALRAEMGRRGTELVRGWFSFDSFEVRLKSVLREFADN